MRKFIILIILLVITFSEGRAEEVNSLSRNSELNKNDLTEIESLKKKTQSRPQRSKFLKNSDEEFVIQQYDLERGIRLKDYSTSDDHLLLDLSYQISSDPTSPDEVTGYDIALSKKINLTWISLLISNHAANFKSIAADNDQFVATAEDVDNSTVQIFAIGAGVSYKSSLIQTLISSDDLFEVISSHLTYNTANFELLETDYTGLGIRADMSLHKRLSKRVHAGIKFSYHLSQVKRKQLQDTETSNDRSLLLSWSSIGLNIGYYF